MDSSVLRHPSLALTHRVVGGQAVMFFFGHSTFGSARPVIIRMLVLTPSRPSPQSIAKDCATCTPVRFR